MKPKKLTATRPGDSVVSVTVGTLKSERAGRIVLVYLDGQGSDSLVVRYDQLSGMDRVRVKALAEDPLHVLAPSAA